MGRPRCSLAELEGLVRLAEVGGDNIGQYLSLHGEVLAERLGVPGYQLRALGHVPDEVAARELRPLLQRRADQLATARADALQQLAAGAAQHLAATAVWSGSAVALDVRVLLGELLADRARKHVRFDAADTPAAFDASFPRSLLVGAARVLGARTDVGAWVDRDGLHLRWKQGRGGLNLVSQWAPQDASVLRVVLPPPALVQVPVAAPAPLAAAVPIHLPAAANTRARPNAAASRWLSEALSEIAARWH